jgi:hypothetical protein
MTVANKIPSVLFAPKGSISTERALKQILDILENCDYQDVHKLEASIDDVQFMLARINRD